MTASLLLHTAAMAPWGFALAATICLVGLFVALEGLAPGRAFLTGLFWGTAQIWLVCYWTAPALAFYWEQPWWFGTSFLLVASTVFVGIYYGLFALAFVTLQQRFAGTVLALLVAALWVTAELGQSRLLGGDPWMLLGYALVSQPRLIQVADLGGVYLLSFVIVFVNALLLDAWRKRGTPAVAGRSLAVAGSVLGVVVLYGSLRLALPLPQEKTRRVAVIQGNNDLGWQWQSTEHGRSLDVYLRLTHEALSSRPDLVIWPESAVTFFVATEHFYREKIVRLARSTGVELILGAPHADTTEAERPRYFNSAFHLDRDGQITGRYDKVHLLPFAEYFPLQTIAILQRQFGRVRMFTPGEAPRLLASPLGPVAVAICFEGIFPSLVRSYMERGAGVLINLSNDSWLGSGTGAEQHLAMVVLRAVEHRTWVVRATTTGVSAIIDPFGRIVQRTRTFEEAILQHDIAALHVETVYERIGDSLAGLCVSITVLAIVTAVRRKRVPNQR